MIILRKAFNKKEIQYVYDFINYSLLNGFNAVYVDSDNNVSSDNFIQNWSNANNLTNVKRYLNSGIPSEDFQIYHDNPELRELMLLFYLKSSIIESINNNPKQNETLSLIQKSINIHTSFFLDSKNVSYFKDWYEYGFSHQTLADYNHFKKENFEQVFTGTGFFSLVNHNQKSNVIAMTEEEHILLKKFKEDFEFKTLIVFPGNKNIKEEINRYRETFDVVARSMGVPLKAIGLNRLNLALSLEEAPVNLSLVHYKVGGYQVYQDNEYFLHLNTYLPSTCIHELAHFFSSIIYHESKIREIPFSNPRKWWLDKPEDNQKFKAANQVYLDWMGRHINNSSWEDYQYEVEDLSLASNVHKFNEQIIKGFYSNFPSNILQEAISLATTNVQIKKSFDFNVQKYIENVFINTPQMFFDSISKICAARYPVSINDTISETSSVLLKAYKEYLEKCDELYFQIPVKNKQMKNLIRFAPQYGYVDYLANPEEFWARACESLLNPGFSLNPEISYTPLTEMEGSLDEIREKVFTKTVSLNSQDRLHILYIFKYLIEEIYPDVKIIPEKSPVYKGFIMNCQEEDISDVQLSKEILYSSITKAEKNKKHSEIKP